MKKLLIAVCVISVCVWVPYASAAPAPVYVATVDDAQWTETAEQGVYEVPTSAENYAVEQWERPIEGDKYSDSPGGTRTSSGKYYAYGDVTQGQFGIDDDWFYAAVTVAGDFLHEPTKDEDTQGLKGHYYVYFDTGDGNQLALAIDDASGLQSSFDHGDNVGKGFVYGPNFGTQVSDANLQVRADGLVVEMALELSSVGLTRADFGQLDWLFAGVAVSNPGSQDKLLIRDTWPTPDGNSIEYDTVVGPLAIPEPAVIGLIAMVSFVSLFVRRLFR